MDIRTKLVLALVLVALSSMALLGTFAYQTTAQMLQQISVRQLNALAESRKDDIQNVYEGWQDKVSLVRSRTQLRLNLVRYNERGDVEAVAGIRRILDEALTSVDVFERIALFDRRGEEVVRVGESSVEQSFRIPDGDAVEFVGSFPMADGAVHIVLRSALTLDDTIIGGVEVVLSTADLRSVVSDYTGLGETGEVLIVMQEDSEWVRVLHPLRHQKVDHKRIPANEVSAGVRAALTAAGQGALSRDRLGHAKAARPGTMGSGVRECTFRRCGSGGEGRATAHGGMWSSGRFDSRAAAADNVPAAEGWDTGPGPSSWESTYDGDFDAPPAGSAVWREVCGDAYTNARLELTPAFPSNRGAWCEAALAALAPTLTATCCADEDGPGCGQNGQVPRECGVDCAHLWAPYAAQCPGEAAGLGDAALRTFFGGECVDDFFGFGFVVRERVLHVCRVRLPLQPCL